MAYDGVDDVDAVEGLDGEGGAEGVDGLQGDGADDVGGADGVDGLQGGGADNVGGTDGVGGADDINGAGGAAASSVSGKRLWDGNNISFIGTVLILNKIAYLLRFSVCLLLSKLVSGIFRALLLPEHLILGFLVGVRSHQPIVFKIGVVDDLLPPLVLIHEWLESSQQTCKQGVVNMCLEN